MQTIYAIMGILYLLFTFAWLIRIIVALKKSKVNWQKELMIVSYCVLFGLHGCVQGRIIQVPAQIQHWLNVSFYCLLAIGMYPMYRAMWQQHKAEKAAQAAQKVVEAQEPTRVAERIANR